MSRLQDQEQIWNCSTEDESPQDHTLTGSSSDLSDAADDSSRLRTENAILKAESRVLNESMATGTVRTLCLEAELAAKGKEVESLKSKVETITISARQECAGELEEIVRDLHVAVEKLVVENKTLKSRRREVERRMQLLQQENQTLHKECLLLRARLQEAVEKVAPGQRTPKRGSVGPQALERVRPSDIRGVGQSGSCAQQRQEQQQHENHQQQKQQQQLQPQQQQKSKESAMASWTNFFANVLNVQISKMSASHGQTQSQRGAQQPTHVTGWEGVTDSHDNAPLENAELD